MKLQKLILVALIILGAFIIFTAIVFYRPDWFSFSPELVNKTVSLFTAILAFATLLLAYAAIETIKNSNEQEKRDRKEHLLSEVIEWATKIAECGIEPSTPEFEIEEVEEKEVWSFMVYQKNKLDTLQLLRTRSVGMENIAEKIGSSLRKTVDVATNNLKNQIQCLYGFKITEDLTGAREVIKNNKLLYASAVNVIEEATKIKARDIT